MKVDTAIIIIIAVVGVSSLSNILFCFWRETCKHKNVKRSWLDWLRTRKNKSEESLLSANNVLLLTVIIHYRDSDEHARMFNGGIVSQTADVWDTMPDVWAQRWSWEGSMLLKTANPVILSFQGIENARELSNMLISTCRLELQELPGQLER